MSIIKPLLIADLGQLYQDWREAPTGTMLAFGSPFFTGRGNDWSKNQGQRIAVRADSVTGEKFLVAVQPDVQLVSFPPSGSDPITATFAGGPAADISKRYGLSIGNLAPKPATDELGQGDIVAEFGKDRFLAYAGPAGRVQRYLVLRGEQSGVLVDRPNNFYLIGKLTVVELH